MKVTLKQLLESSASLARLATEKLPVKTAYIIAKNIRVINPELEAYEKARVALVTDKYGIKDDSGNMSVMPDKLNEFIAELSELQSVELELDVQKITLPDSTIISGNDLYSLDWLVDIAE